MRFCRRRSRFSVAGSHLAAVTDHGIVVDRRCLRGGPATAGPLAWLGSTDLVVVRGGARPMLRRIAAGRGHASTAACSSGPIDALATWAAPNGLAVAIRNGAGVELRALARSSRWGDCPVVRSELLLARQGAQHVSSLDVR